MNASERDLEASSKDRRLWPIRWAAKETMLNFQFQILRIGRQQVHQWIYCLGSIFGNDRWVALEVRPQRTDGLWTTANDKSSCVGLNMRLDQYRLP